MKIEINIEVDITDGEIKTLRDIFSKDRNRQYNTIFAKLPGSEISKHIVDSLITKNIIIEDSLHNAKLTPIGNIVLDRYDAEIRDKKLEEILK